MIVLRTYEEPVAHMCLSGGIQRSCQGADISIRFHAQQSCQHATYIVMSLEVSTKGTTQS